MQTIQFHISQRVQDVQDLLSTRSLRRLGIELRYAKDGVGIQSVTETWGDDMGVYVRLEIGGSGDGMVNIIGSDGQTMLHANSLTLSRPDVLDELISELRDRYEQIAIELRRKQAEGGRRGAN